MRVFEKNRYRWVAIAPRGPCKAGGEAERAPRFEIFLEAVTVDKLKRAREDDVGTNNSAVSNMCSNLRPYCGPDAQT